MARSTIAPQAALPNSPDRHLNAINQKLDILVVDIKNRHSLVKQKLAQQLAHVRKIDPQAYRLSNKYVLIAMLNSIFEVFDTLDARQTLIKELDGLLEFLSTHHKHDGYAKGVRHAFIMYFHKLLRNREALPEGFLQWFESYILVWQKKHVFGHHFDFNKWKVVSLTDLLKTYRNFNIYPKKQWQANNNISRENSRDDLAPGLDDTVQTDSQFTLGDVLNHPIRLIYFLIEYNVLRMTKREYEALLKVCRSGSNDEQIALFDKIMADISDNMPRVVSTPLIRVLANSDDNTKTPNKLSLHILNKLLSANVPVQIHCAGQAQAAYATHLASSVCLDDPDGKKRIILYSNPITDLAALKKAANVYHASYNTGSREQLNCTLRQLNSQFKKTGFQASLSELFDNQSYDEQAMPKKVVGDDDNSYRISYFHASANAAEMPKKLHVHVTNLFSPMKTAAPEYTEPYRLQRIVKPEQHHFELLKISCIRLLEEYLTRKHVASDRSENANRLIKQIQQLPVSEKSFIELQKLLNNAKKMALDDDAITDATRFSFFQRNRFGSRYMTLLDDLRERTLYCQNQENRAQFLPIEQQDSQELEEQFKRRSSDLTSHATQYLLKQVQRKRELLISAFGEEAVVTQNTPHPTPLL
jgi:hypothetical protein